MFLVGGKSQNHFDPELQCISIGASNQIESLTYRNVKHGSVGEDNVKSEE